MLQSQIFTKTRRDAPKDEIAKNAQLLIRAGFVHKEMTGVYAYLPLGWRVMNKVAAIVREEMNEIGGEEVALPALLDPQPWQKSGRWDDAVLDVWFKTRLKNNTEIGLATTNEESLTRTMRDHIDSYRDLPRYPYQIQKKFRNELRAKSGLLRGREFLMKDLYSFSSSQKDLDAFYVKCQKAYQRIFDRVGIGEDTFLTFASGGSFSKFSHEFQTICDTGEDTIYLARKKRLAVNKDVCHDDVLAEIGLRRSELEEVKAIEVGNIFKLGTKYSEPIGLTFLDERGQRQPVIMGSYGIGIGRVMAAVVEKMADEKGLVWPRSIAPYAVHMLGLGLKSRAVRQECEHLVSKIEKLGVEVLFDDRDISAGEKFYDADLLGLPWRLVISEKTLAMKKIELRKRTGDKAEFLTEKAVIETVTAPS